MTKITLDEANKIASTYFKLLIDRHTAQGFSAQVVEKKGDKSSSDFYLEFCNARKDTKSYKIVAHNNSF
ncbi:MAG: hypothetical protein KDC88_07165 [Ignavibacteriae bacterium]|nr:hypothetical protein [Ignavibacteriota bacterium]MCB9209442.1 hypothetical protein [Ignavibacteriales bacterium]MCB9258085.1 hypothetical protein [Ignavibacteriales bacterium]